MTKQFINTNTNLGNLMLRIPHSLKTQFKANW